MKWKRRIEVTRYSRRVTVLEGRDDAGASTVPHAADVIADVLMSLPSAPEADGEGEEAAGEVELHEARRRGLLMRLRNLLKLRR